MPEELQAAWIETLRRTARLLPPALFARLRDFPSLIGLSSEEEQALADLLEQSIAALDSLYYTLTTFIPRYVLDLSPAPGEPLGAFLEGSFVFADVTGFTALTGELSRRGTEGLEEMNRLMRRLFTALLDPLLTSGGDLLIFAGDAVLAWFPARPGGRDACWAARTALRLVEATVPFADLHTPYGDFSLTMSAGIEKGRALAVVVGTRERMECLVSGGPVQGAMQAEREAQAGQVFAGPGALAFLRPDEFVLQGSVVESIRGGELADYEPVPPARRRRRMAAIFSRRIPDLIEHLHQALAQVEALAPFIPPDLFAQIARKEDIRQHPPVAVQFVNVMGLEEIAFGPAGLQGAAEAFHRYFVQAHEVVTDREGIISQVDAYVNGFTLLNPFGAPTHHEGVPRLAASAALELTQVLDRVNQECGLDPPLKQRIGLTYDRIFTGEIGSPHRREYVVAGPAVNLAARLMSKAEAGQIVLDAAMWNAIEDDFVADDLEPVSLKGIAQPVPRFSLRGLRRGKGLRLANYPLVGFRKERAALEKRIERAVFGGGGGALALVGEVGSGKSLLVDALAETARRRGFAVLTGLCRPFAQMTPYFPWTGLVSRWADLEDAMDQEARRRQLQERLADLDMLPSAPAFADLLGLSPLRSRTGSSERMAASSKAAGRGIDLYTALKRQAESGKGRQGVTSLLAERIADVRARRAESACLSIWKVAGERASISQALLVLLERLAARKPTLLIIEDIQWIDLDSRRVLERVTELACSSRLMPLVTARPDTPWEGERLELPPLSDAESLSLAAYALRASRLNDDLAEWLLARAGGRPLFILIYCRALRDANAVVVDPASGEAMWSGPPPDLPLSLQELWLAQVEQLDQETREILRRGAIIGSAFPDWLIARLCQDAFPPARVVAALDQAARRSLIAPLPPALEYVFATQSLHDAVYMALSHAARRAWHVRVGDLLADADEATRYERLEQIAHHYERGDDPLKAARFARLSGDKARARQVDEAALAFYGQALAVGEVGAAEDQRLAREGLGDIYALRGDWASASASYRIAAEGASPEEARRLQAKQALLPSADVQAVEESWRALSPSDPLWPWMGAAQVWLRAGLGETDSALDLCQQLLFVSGKTVGSLLQEALESLQKGSPLPTYEAFFSLFAGACLRGGGSRERGPGDRCNWRVNERKVCGVDRRASILGETQEEDARWI